MERETQRATAATALELSVSAATPFMTMRLTEIRILAGATDREVTKARNLERFLNLSSYVRTNGAHSGFIGFVPTNAEQRDGYLRTFEATRYIKTPERSHMKIAAKMKYTMTTGKFEKFALADNVASIMSATRCRSCSTDSPSFEEGNQFNSRRRSQQRSKSPGKLLMQVHDRLIDESNKKDALAQELNSLKRRIEEFSIRLDFLLKCMCMHFLILHVMLGSNFPQTCVSHVKELSDELSNFVFQSCMARNDDCQVMTEAYHSIKKLFDRSEEDRQALESERNELLRMLAGMCLSSTNAIDDPSEDDADRIRSRILDLKQNLMRSENTLKDMRHSYECQIRKIELANRDEVRNLREALSNATAHAEKWKSLYLEDVSRLREELVRKIGTDTVQITKGNISKSC